MLNFIIRLIKILTGFSLQDSCTFRKFYTNSQWLVVDHLVRSGFGIIVTALIARYLGPNQFGLFSYVLTFSTTFYSFASLGVNEVTIREMIKKPSQTVDIIYSSFCIKLTGSLLSLALIFFITIQLHANEPWIMYCILLVSISLLFQAFDVIDLYFQSQSQFKYSVLSKCSVFFVFAIIKIILIYIHAPLITFLLTTMAEATLTAIIFLFTYQQVTSKKEKKGSFKFPIMKFLLKDGWLIFLTIAVASFQMRIDQIILRTIKGDSAIGIFSAATKISDAAYLSIGLLISSIFPIIVTIKRDNPQIFHKKIEDFTHSLMILAIGLTLILTISASWIIQLVFGSTFIQAGQVLSIHIWSLIFVILGGISHYWLMTEGLLKYNLYRTLIGCTINILLNLLLIPRWGVYGCALSAVLGHASTVVPLLLFKKTRHMMNSYVHSLNMFRPINQLLSKD